MASQIKAYTPKTRPRRRNRARPLNHQKTNGKRSVFAGQKSKNRGQG
jgi:hypothetical protein